MDHQAWCRAWAAEPARDRPEKLGGALADAKALAQQHRVPVVVEVILEKVTNIAMGTEIDKINEFEAIDCRHPEGTPKGWSWRGCWTEEFVSAEEPRSGLRPFDGRLDIGAHRWLSHR